MASFSLRGCAKSQSGIQLIYLSTFPPQASVSHVKGTSVMLATIADLLRLVRLSKLSLLTNSACVTYRDKNCQCNIAIVVKWSWFGYIQALKTTRLGLGKHLTLGLNNYIYLT